MGSNFGHTKRMTRKLDPRFDIGRVGRPGVAGRALAGVVQDADPAALAGSSSAAEAGFVEVLSRIKDVGSGFDDHVLADRKGVGKRQILRGVADHDLILSGIGYPRVRTAPIRCYQFRIDVDGEVLELARLKDAGLDEGFQFISRLVDGRVWRSDVKLADFASGDFAGIRH